MALTERELCEWHDDGLIQWRDPPIDPEILFDRAHLIVLPTIAPAEAAPVPANRSKRVIALNGFEGRRADGTDTDWHMVRAGDPETLAVTITNLIEH